MDTPQLLKPLLQWWQRLSKRQHLLVIVLASLLLVWGVDLVLFHPLRRHALRLRRAVLAAQQRLTDAVIAGEQAAAVNETFAAYESYVQALGSSESALATMLSEVEAAVRESGMKQLNLSPVSDRAEASSTLAVRLETEASPEQLVRLLDRLQRSTQLLKVTEMTLRTSEGSRLRGSFVISKLVLAAS